MEAFSSLIGHRLLRWQIRMGFESWVQGKEDLRLISTEGGYKGIARLIGCGNSHKAISLVKGLLYAQAYGQFVFHDDSQGNMVILREIERHQNGEPSRINIILGDMLLPNYTHLLPKGEKRRLIPIPELPPLIGSNNTYASQSLLQILLLEEFSNQSKVLYERGSIHLPKEKWEGLAREAHLPKTSIVKVLSGWIGGGFIKRVMVDKVRFEYTLGEKYLQYLGFIQLQGKSRVQGKKTANKSIIKVKSKV